jgi:hypothetical protein
MMTHTDTGTKLQRHSGSATQIAEVRRIKVQGQPGQKLARPPCQPTSHLWWHVSVIPATQKAVGEITV